MLGTTSTWSITMSRPLQLLRLSVLTSMLLTVSSMAQAPEDVRVALVIGNAAYISVPPLNNAVNDAKAMGDTLRKLGFTVIEVRDGSKAQMTKALAKAREALNGKRGVGMLYYAGHGLQIDARNYMVPVDAKISKAGDVAPQTIDVSGVVDVFKAAGNRMNILVLDACRDNPFGGITSGRGLAPLDAPSGTFLAYATAPGNVAEDGDVKSGNGLYTQYLLQELSKPQSRIEDVFKRVRFSVRKASNGRQIPWESTSLEDDFHFRDGKITSLVKPTAQQLQVEFAQEKVDWDRIQSSRNVDDFYAFIQKYPNGTIAEAAHARLNELSKPTLTVQADVPGGREQTYTQAFLRLGDSYERRDVESGTVAKGTVINVNDHETAVEIVYSTGSRQIQLFSPQGGFIGIKDVFRTNPTDPFAPSGLLQVGSAWKSTSQIEYVMPNMPKLPLSTKISKIVAREKITVPAGTFDTFKIEKETLYEPGGPNKRNLCTFWVARDIPTPVKVNCLNELSNGPATTSHTELVNFTRGI